MAVVMLIMLVDVITLLSGISISQNLVCAGSKTLVEFSPLSTYGLDKNREKVELKLP